MVGEDRQRSGRDGIRVKTLEKQLYRTRIGLQRMVANDRRGSGAAGHFRGNFGGNFRCSIGVTPVLMRLMRKIAAKALSHNSHSAFSDLNSISRAALPNWRPTSRRLVARPKVDSALARSLVHLRPTEVRRPESTARLRSFRQLTSASKRGACNGFLHVGAALGYNWGNSANDIDDLVR